MELLTINELLIAEVYTSMKEALKEPEKVYKLDLSGHKLTELPSEILELPNLQFLSIGSNKFGEFPQEILELEKLQVLYMPSCGLRALPQDMDRLKHLKHLSIPGNLIRELPPSFFRLDELKLLDIYVNLLERLPPEIKGLRSLDALDISMNPIAELPEELGELSNLRMLVVRGATRYDRSEDPEFNAAINDRYPVKKPMKALPESITRLKKLRILDMGHNGFVRLPKDIGNMELEKINVSFTEMPLSEVERLRKALPDTKVIAVEIK